MNALKNALILLALLALVGVIAFGLHLAAQKENDQARYSHPISRPGAHC